jgi:hypothetical protein
MVPRGSPERTRRLRVGTLALLVLIGLFSPPAVSTDASGDIPDTILDAAARHLTSRVGEEFYLAYLRFDRHASTFVEARDESVFSEYSDKRFAKAHYVLVFEFRMPQHGFVDHRMTCITYADGALLDFQAVPDCANDPKECRFPIDEDKAKQIAVAEGLEAGITEWELRFFWLDHHQTYIWVVSNTLTDTADSGSGNSVVIDANSGVVYPATSWVRCD